MSFYIFTGTEGINLRHEKDPYSVTLLNDAMKPISATFLTGTDDYDSAVCLDKNRIAIGYWNSEMQIFNLKSGALEKTFPFKRIGPMGAFHENGNQLIFKSRSQVILLNVETSEYLAIKGIRALDSLIFLKNELLVPAQKKGELLRVSLETGEVTPLLLPIDATFFDIKQSPTTNRLILIDRRKGLHCLDTSCWEMVWSVSLKKILGQDHMAVGQFSGDGTLFGAAISASNHNYTLVFDAQSGEQLRRLESIEYGLPYQEKSVRSQATRENSFEVCTLDLVTGEEETVILSKKEKNSHE